MGEQLRSTTGDTAASVPAAAALEPAIRKVIALELGIPIEMVEQANSLRETPSMSSLGLLRAISGLEKHFGIELPDELVFGIESLSELAEVVHQQLGRSVTPESSRPA